MENKRNHNPLGKTWDEIEKERKSTRKLALEWWNKMDEWNQLWNVAHSNLFPFRHTNSLTGREIEKVWRKVTNQDAEDGEKLHAHLKQNQKQFKIGDTVKCIKDIPFYDSKGNKNVITKDNLEWFNSNLDYYVLVSTKNQLPVICVNCKEIYNNPVRTCKCGSRTFAPTHPSNSKQFKEFNPELFKSYIDKFSDEDKIAALRVMFKAIGITSKDKLEYYLARY